MFCFLEHLDQELDEPRLHSCTLPCLVCWQELLILLLGVLLPNNKYIIIKPQQKCSSIKVASIESIPCYKNRNRTDWKIVFYWHIRPGLYEEDCIEAAILSQQQCVKPIVSNVAFHMELHYCTAAATSLSPPQPATVILSLCCHFPSR